MTYALRFVLAGLFSAALVTPALADEPVIIDDGNPVPTGLRADPDATLEDFKWTKRPIIVFADSENDPAFGQQLDFLASRADELIERDVVVLVDTNPDELSPLREKLRPRGFMLVLIGKDGGVKLRKPFPWDVRELMRSIDKMPLRQREVREQR